MAATKEELERWYEKVCVAGFADFDPVQFPRRFSQRQDAEIAAFLAAAIAWGRRDLILRSAEKMFAIMGGRPFDFVSSGKYRKLAQGGAGGNIHRTFFESDLKYFCRGFNRCFKRYDGTLENIFLRAGGVWQGIALFRDEMARANGGFYSKHIADPGAGEGGSACKRINLALRWLVRGGPVDLGLWKNISPASLFIPLDVHVSRTARSLGLLERRSNDKKAVMLLTEKLKVFCPDDPVKYDFALFGMGAIPQA
ncbi:MAG: TIGR02757 family protein [Spirochaetes bacterium]|nr:TIGR02757 family protein [Spirochaetota bacterium]